MRIRLIRAVTIFLVGLLACITAFGQEGCRPAPPPLHPVDSLEMNTVALTDSPLVKTVKVEKEVFLCANNIIKDVNIFTEIIEDIFGEPIQKQFEVVTCRKNITDPFQTDCSIEVPNPLIPELPPCRVPSPGEQPQPPAKPLAMNTVSFQHVVKTVKTEKEVFLCGPFIVDVNIFTEIREFLDTMKTRKEIEKAMCIKDMDGNVRGCGFF